MSTYSYIFNEFATPAKAFSQKTQCYLEAHNLNVLPQNYWIERESRQKHWLDKNLAILLNQLQNKDILIIHNFTHLARSAFQAYQIFNLLQQKNITLHVIDSNIIAEFKRTINTKEILFICSRTEDCFIARRTTEAIYRRQKSSLGPSILSHNRRNNKISSIISPEDKAKLDNKKDDILRYLNIKVSKIAIAKLVECEPKTLQKWLKNVPEYICND